jgi:mono/diheme cytochrome c family protein
LIALGALGAVGLLAVACAYLAALLLGGRVGDPHARSPLAATPALISKGAYLAAAGDCAACHTTKGGAAFAGGLAIASPVGVIYSPNITPDPKTGIGAYTFGDFERVIRRGVLPNGQTLYPAMPYPSFSRLTDQDVAALYAYFMHGVAPVSLRDRPEGIVWPLSLRWPLTYWRWLFAPAPRPFSPADGMTPTVARGAYLVEGLGHCGACHTARALTLQEVALTPKDGARYLAGSRFNGWYAPSLRRDDLSGLGLWTDGDIPEASPPLEKWGRWSPTAHDG